MTAALFYFAIVTKPDRQHSMAYDNLQSQVLDMNTNSIAFLGGDKRSLFTADHFLKLGFEVYLAGFDLLESVGGLILTDTRTALAAADIVVLPVTGIKGNIIPCYFSNKELNIDKDTFKNKLVFMGRSDTLLKLCPDARVYDLLEREDFAVANAQPTAEGAVQVAMENYEDTILGSRCLVIGYGRIGRILSQMLRALNADVDVVTRSAEKAAYIRADGNTPVNLTEVVTLGGYDIVFNTVPTMVINKQLLHRSDSDTLIIDLASAPGGVDFDEARSHGFTAIQALSLPGKCSPAAAGRIISDTILTVLGEEYSWKKQA